MKFSRNKILIGIAIIMVLGFTYWYGGNAPGLQGWNPKADADTPVDEVLIDYEMETKDELKELEREKKEERERAQKEKEEKEKAEKEELEKAKKEKEDKSEEKDKVEEVKKEGTKKGIESRPGGKEDKLSASEKTRLAKEKAKGSSSQVAKGSESYSENQGMEIDSSTGKDKYLTDPVPEGKPIPVEPENSKKTDVEKYCTLSVRCDTILDNMDWLDPNKVELVPKDGVIYATKKVKFYEGESVFDLLLREMKNSKIHMEFSKTPMYNSVYIEGINNLYEFDCGELSGWMYKVNDWFPNYGASRYAVKEGDKVEWVYTCDLGVDVGGFSAVGGE